ARDRSQASPLLQHALTIKLLWAGGTLALLIVTATILRPQPDVRFACYLIGGSLVFRSYMLTIRGVLQGLERFGWDAAIAFADRGLLLAFGLAALFTGTGLRGLTIAFVLARGTALALAAAVTQTRLGGLGFRFDRGVWENLHREALPLGFFLVVLNLYSYVDGVMLGYLRTDAETGLYTAAYKIYEGFTYAALAMSAVLTPRLSALFVSDRPTHRRVAIGGVAASASIGAAVGIVAFAIGMPLLVFLFGADFAAATAPFRILVVGLPVVFAIWILHAIAISVDRERLLLTTGLVGLAVNVGLNFYVIPRYGPNGAALATVIGEVVSMAVLVGGLRSDL
ncbi:MAG TPA: oligosaccharide flippase family protein, partial [Vicinamibacterales bacterium]|nr:oligosaccharide flippase family protein [Vicinamibacterales bacterium]